MAGYEVIFDEYLDGKDVNGLEQIDNELLNELKERAKRNQITELAYIIPTLDGIKPGTQTWVNWYGGTGPEPTRQSIKQSWVYNFLKKSPLYCKIRYQKNIENNKNKKQLKIQIAHRKETLDLVELDDSHSEADFARFIGTPEEDIHWQENDEFEQETLKDGFDLSENFGDQVNDIDTDYEELVPFSATPTPDGLRRRCEQGKSFAQSLRKFDNLTNGNEGEREINSSKTSTTVRGVFKSLFRILAIDVADKIKGRDEYRSWKKNPNGN